MRMEVVVDLSLDHLVEEAVVVEEETLVDLLQAVCHFLLA